MLLPSSDGCAAGDGTISEVAGGWMRSFVELLLVPRIAAEPTGAAASQTAIVGVAEQLPCFRL